MRPLLLLMAALSLAACQTVAPVTRQVHPETRPNCESACEQVGMRLTGIVFVSEIGGCVCEPAAGERPGAAAIPPAGRGASASAGMAVIIAAQQQEQQRQSSSPTPTSPTSPTSRP